MVRERGTLQLILMRLRPTRTAGLLILATAVLALAFVASVTGPTAVGLGKTDQPQGGSARGAEVVLTPTADTYVQEAAADWNFGTSTTLGTGSCLGCTVRDRQRILLRFDLADLPTSATINSAALRLYQESSSGLSSVELSVRRVIHPWDELSATWNDRPLITNDSFASVVSGTQAGWRTWDVTSLVQSWQDGAYPNYGFGLKGPEGAVGDWPHIWGRTFTSREGSSNRPQLVLNFTVVTPTRTATPTSSPTSTPTSTPTPTPTPIPDLGDAPDSTNSSGTAMTAYPSVESQFPTVFGPGSPPAGPLHRNHRLLFHLGPSISAEDEADAGPDDDGANNLNPPADASDLDGFDDGLAVPSNFFGRCQATMLQYTVNVLPGAPQNAYVNVWVDWNRNGKWGDVLTCSAHFAPEWAVQNQVIRLPGPGLHVFDTPTFLPYSADPSQDVWLRITISEGPASAADGSGPANGWANGETEDYLISTTSRPAPRPTINLDPDHGYPGQRIAVSGEGVAPYPGVRIVWRIGGTTQVAAEVSVRSSQAFNATIKVPDDAPLGPAEVCAAVTGTDLAEFVCTDFTIHEPPPGVVQGQVPLDGPASEIDASFVLLDGSGEEAYSAPVNPDGSFRVEEVTPATYTGIIIGTIPTFVKPVTVRVPPGEVVTVTLTAIPVLECVEEDPVAAVADVRGTPNGPPAGGEADFGTYVALGPSGDVVNVTFRADVQARTSTVIERVEFIVEKPDGSEITIGSDDTPPYETTYNVSLLPEGTSTLKVSPITTSGCAEPAYRSIEVVGSPVDDPYVRDAYVSWDAGQRRYDFAGTIPDVAGLLPIVYPDPPPDLPLVGRLENRLDAGVRFEGSLELGGELRMRVLRLQALARLLGFDVFNQSQDLIPPGEEGLERIAIPLGRHRLASFSKDVTVYRGVIWGDWGVVTVNASISVGISGDLVLEGTVRPLVPALEASLTASVGPRLSVSIWVDLLLGVVSAGADATAQMTLALPLRLNTEHAPPVWFDAPCMGVDVTLIAWARVDLLFWKKKWNLDPWTLVDYRSPGCASSMLTLAAEPAVPPPRVMAAPSVTSGPGGQMLAVYIQDTTPDAQTPTMKVIARFWDSQTERWAAAMPLTDGSRAVQDPVVAFVGEDGHALVAWTENTMTEAEDDAAGDDLVAILARQEIFFAYWDGQTWSSPERLTDDELPDGRAALAGDALGATLAWVRDTDGNIATRSDSRIAVVQWNIAEAGWSPIDLVGVLTTQTSTRSATLADALNAQPSVARWNGQVGLAWTVDMDGDLTTNDDRHIASAELTPAGWAVEVPQALPAGADSPGIAVSPDGETHVGFLVRGKDADGITDTGVGNQATLWTARRDAGGDWQAAWLTDEQGRPVRAEQPLLHTSSQGETLLLFRRFGEVGTNGELGQLALSQLAPDGSGFAAPLYVTDEPRQHWQAALAINQLTNEAITLNVSRAAIGESAASAISLQQFIAPASTAARPGLQSVILTASNDPVESITVDSGADPAIDPTLALSEQHAVPGSSVVITATLRNLGRAPASGLAVNFYAGTPVTGTLLTTIDVPGTLHFNDARTVTYQVTATGGEQPVTAQVTTEGQDIYPDNNQGTVKVGALPPPTFLRVVPSARYTDALDLTWLLPDMEGVAGYRILRSGTSGGPYEMVGETTVMAYTDRLLRRGAYFYVVQAFDDAGVRSPYSTEAGGTLPLATQYLPLVQR